MMRAELEHVTSWLRVWQDGDQYGDPYEWFVGVRWLNRTEIEICGQTEKLTQGIRNAVIQVCKEHGIKRILAVTYPSRVRTVTWIDVQ